MSKGVPARLRKASAGDVVSTVWFAGAWFGVYALIWLVVSRLADITTPVRLTVVLQSLTPLAFLPMYALLVTALLARRFTQSGFALVLVVVHIFSVAPAIGGADPPHWAASAPTIRVVSANVYDHNSLLTAAASTLVAQDADVMMVVELTRPMLRALVTAGLDDRYPYQLVGSFSDKRSSSTESIFSRVPFDTARKQSIGQQDWPMVTITVGDSTVDLLAVHAENALRNVDEWNRELAQIRELSSESHDPIIVAGDFNSTRWSPEFGRLLGSGMVDASESAGDGLSFSWPVGRLLPFPVMRLDHALGSAGLAPTAVKNLTIPGSDHRALQVTWAVQQVGA
ncbi:MAG: endonuclease/exonuclease/phosphatase family protein [Ilumatobacteraceae bacterium]